MKAPYRIFYSPNVLKKWSQNGTKIYFGRFFGKKKAPAATPPAEKNGLWPIKCLYGSKKGPKKLAKILVKILAEILVKILVKILAEILGDSFGGIFCRH